MRRFIGIEPAGALRADYERRHPNLHKQFVDMTSTSSLVRDNLNSTRFEIRASVIDCITPNVCSGKQIAYAKWTSEQKRALIEKFVLEAVTEACSVTEAAHLTCDPLRPERLDASRMVLMAITAISVWAPQGLTACFPSASLSDGRAGHSIRLEALSISDSL